MRPSNYVIYVIDRDGLTGIPLYIGLILTNGLIGDRERKAHEAIREMSSMQRGVGEKGR